MNNLEAYALGFTRIVYNEYKQGNKVAFLLFLGGCAPFILEGAPGTGHNIVMVIDAIHNYKKKHPDCDIEKGYQQGLNKLAYYATSPENIITLVDCINYELKKEKDGTNVFCVNCNEALNTLHKNIEQYHSEIISEMKDFDEWAKEQNNYMKSNFGLHF